MRDYENAEEETLVEAKKTSTKTEERQKLLNLIEGLRLSRQNTVIKLIKLIKNMNEKGLWITYVTAEQADEGLRTPRKSLNPETFLKRGARTAIKDHKQEQLLKVTTSPAKNLE